MSKKKIEPRSFSSHCDLLVVTDAEDIAVLKVIYDHAKPGRLKWDFSRPGQARLKNIGFTRFPQVPPPPDADSRLISLDLGYERPFPRTPALLEALAKAGFEIDLDLAPAADAENQDPEQEPAAGVQTDSEDEIDDLLNKPREKVTDPVDVAALRDFCDRNDLWLGSRPAGPHLDDRNMFGPNLSIEDGRLAGLDLTFGMSITDLRPLTRLTALRELKFSKNKLPDLSPLAGLTKRNVCGRSNYLLDFRPYL
jgi:hypothetical protein